MRVIAIDASGSGITFAEQMLEDARERFAGAKDMVVFFSYKNISRVQLLKDATTKIATSGGGDGIIDLFNWMEARTLQPTDELIIYHDGMFPWDEVFAESHDRWFTPKFVLMGNFVSKDLLQRFVENDLYLDTVQLKSVHA